MVLITNLFIMSLRPLVWSTGAFSLPGFLVRWRATHIAVGHGTMFCSISLQSHGG